MEFPIEASVRCVDGLCGQSMTVIVDPATEQVTYIAVRDIDRSHTAYLVPVERITGATAELIELSCNRDELEQMAPFIEAEFVVIPATYYGDDLYGYTGPETMVVEHQLVPEGALAVNRGMAVEATDGYIGTVDELVVDKNSGQVTHFLLRKGHFWGEAEVRLSVSQIERVEESTVYLKLDKAHIEVLPMVQAQRHYSRQEIKALAVELIVVTFDDVDLADRALQRLKSLRKAGRAEIRNAAVLVRSEDNKLSFKEIEDVNRRQGTFFGALTGGLIGLLGGPAGMILGAAAGAATGGAAADKIDRGFSDAYLEKLQAELAPGSSALVTLVEQQAVETVTESLAALDGRLTRLPLTDELVTQLTAG